MTEVMAREWNAASYDRVSDPQLQQGIAVVERLRGDGVRVVLDAGCGTGRVSELVLARVPGATLIAVDGSQRMLDEAARRLAPYGDRVSLIRSDLNDPLPVDEPVDAIVSTATFHWIHDHARLFGHLADALRPGGQLVAQCGGAGCIASVIDAIRAAGETWTPWHFAGAASMQSRLEHAGFTDVQTWLHDEPAVFERGPALEEFLATVILGAHLERRAPEEHAAFVRAVADALPEPAIDYVRLNIVANQELSST
jgi:trans-aconitate 2-methyltransferase